MVEDGVGVVDGAQVGAADGAPVGDPDGDLDGDGVGDGADPPSSWDQDFTEADVFVRRLVPGPWGPRWIWVNRCWW